jgi:carboxyl-terminal processing protease
MSETQQKHKKLPVMKNVLMLLLVMCVFSMACEEKPGAAGASDSVRAYLNEILDIMEQRSLNRNNINWVSLRGETQRRADELNVQSIAAGDEILMYVLSALNDNTSHIITPDNRWLFGSSVGCPPQVIASVSAPANVGYVRVDPIAEIEPNGSVSLAYARGLQSTIRNQDARGIKGWVVDIRSTGGNMWPMLAGIGPLLGSGVAGYSIEPDNAAYPWSYNNGISFYNNTPKTSLDTFYTLINQNPKVAVLIDGGTAGAAEAMVISFIGRPNTRIFGTRSCGLTTYIETFRLSNNSYLELAVGRLADRSRNSVSSVVPDDIRSGDDAIREAFTWLNN